MREGGGGGPARAEPSRAALPSQPERRGGDEDGGTRLRGRDHHYATEVTHPKDSNVENKSKGDLTIRKIKDCSEFKNQRK